MIRAGYNAKEIADFALTGFPRTASGISKIARRQGWKKQRRIGCPRSEGYVEFIISGLPPEIRLHIENMHKLHALECYEPAHSALVNAIIALIRIRSFLVEQVEERNKGNFIPTADHETFEYVREAASAILRVIDKMNGRGDA